MNHPCGVISESPTSSSPPRRHAKQPSVNLLRWRYITSALLHSIYSKQIAGNYYAYTLRGRRTSATQQLAVAVPARAALPVADGRVALAESAARLYPAYLSLATARAAARPRSPFARRLRESRTRGVAPVRVLPSERRICERVRFVRQVAVIRLLR